MPQILIAEDEERLAAFIQKGLSLNGYESAVAPDGQLAMQMLKSGDYDLLLLDLGLPIKDGWAVLEELQQESTIPVIVVTAINDAHTRRTLLASGVKAFVSKPFRFSELLARVNGQLSDH